MVDTSSNASCILVEMPCIIKNSLETNKNRLSRRLRWINEEKQCIIRNNYCIPILLRLLYEYLSGLKRKVGQFLFSHYGASYTRRCSVSCSKVHAISFISKLFYNISKICNWFCIHQTETGRLYNRMCYNCIFLIFLV